MGKFKSKCPFCKDNIPKIYTTRTITKKKRRKIKTIVVKDIVGEDWLLHATKCKKLQEFLNKTKDLI